MRIFRNQVGRYRLALPDCVRCQRQGRVITSGFCVGSSDLIGWRTVTVTPAMVGTRVAVFVAIEAKVGDNTTTAEQRAFLDAVHAAGGEARVLTDTAELTAGVE